MISCFIYCYDKSTGLFLESERFLKIILIKLLFIYNLIHILNLKFCLLKKNNLFYFYYNLIHILFYF